MKKEVEIPHKRQNTHNFNRKSPYSDKGDGSRGQSHS